jgi:hypothetical protein
MKTAFWILGPIVVLYLFLSMADDYFNGDQLTEKAKTVRHICFLVASIILVLLHALRHPGWWETLH